MELVRLLVDKDRYMSYKYLRRELAGVRWFDPRDAVYTVQGILRAEDRALGVVPDYTLTAAQVYTDVTIRLTTKQKALYILSSCDMAQQVMDGLPSWVPDWSTQTEMKIDMVMEPYWYASGPVYPLSITSATESFASRTSP